MPSTYAREKALPLRVPPELRARLDALAARLPPGLSLPRNSIAVAALALGVAELGARLDADPAAVHRALAGAAGGAAPGAPSPVEGAAPQATATSPRRAAARDTGGTASRAASPKPSRGSSPARPKRTRAARAPAAPVEGDGPDAPTASMVRELLGVALQPGGGWTVKGLAAALECDRRAVQVFRDGGTGMGRRLQLRAWSLLRGPAPTAAADPG